MRKKFKVFKNFSKAEIMSNQKQIILRLRCLIDRSEHSKINERKIIRIFLDQFIFIHIIELTLIFFFLSLFQVSFD